MSKVFLKSGDEFLIQWLPANVGATATIADINFLWTPDTGGEGIGKIKKTGKYGGVRHDGSKSENYGKTIEYLEFSVYVDEQTGRLWYDDEYGL